MSSNLIDHIIIKYIVYYILYMECYRDNNDVSIGGTIITPILIFLFINYVNNIIKKI